MLANIFVKGIAVEVVKAIFAKHEVQGLESQQCFKKKMEFDHQLTNKKLRFIEKTRKIGGKSQNTNEKFRNIGKSQQKSANWKYLIVDN